jgi:hypothetical protein
MSEYTEVEQPFLQQPRRVCPAYLLRPLQWECLTRYAGRTLRWDGCTRLEIFVYNGERRGVGTIKMHDLLTGKVQVNDPNTAAKA